MPSPFNLLKTLTRLFQICEVFIGIGLLITVSLFPVATRWVARGQADISIVVINDSLKFTINTASSLPIPLLVSSGPGSGDITFGRVFLLGIQPGESPTLSGQQAGVKFHSLDGLVTLKRPANACAILDVVKWPLLLSVICGGAISIAVLELLSRLFKNVSDRDTFTGASVRSVQLIAALVIAGNLAQMFLLGWLQRAMVSILTQQASGGTIRFEHWTIYNTGEIFAGLVILALAEVFRQGLALKEEAKFTI